MRIKACHIDNFGKISDFDYSFGDTNLNVISENNSWGKTTFSVFLKSMFYGLEYNSKKTNERKKYDPWQGGVFGGNLIIEIDGKDYRIERTFGKKDKDDTFRLVDLEIGKECNDYSQNIGEEIFGIDRESFTKSVYIPQCQLQTSMTDSFNAKIGNLTQAKDDISNYEIVKNKLEEKKKEYSSRGKNSKSALLKEDLRILAEKSKERKNTEEVTKLIEVHLEEKKNNLSKLQKQKQVLSETLDKRAKNAQNEALYKNAVNSLEQTKKKLNNILDRYEGKIIVEEDVDNLKTEYENIKSLKQQLKLLDVDESTKQKYKEYEQIFCDGVPTKEFFAEVKGLIEKVKASKVTLESQQLNNEENEKYEALKDFFAEKYPTKEEIDKNISDYHKAELLKKEILKTEVELNSSQESADNNRPTSHLPVALTGASLLVLGLILMIVLSEPLMFVMSGVGLIVMLVGYAVGRKGGRSLEETNRDDMERKISEIAIKKQKCEELEKSYKEFVRCFRVRYSENIVEVLMEIRDKYSEMERLKSEHGKRSESKAIITNEIAQAMTNLSKLMTKYLAGKSTTESGNEERDVSVYESAYEILQEKINTYGQLKEKNEMIRSLEKRLSEHMNVYMDIAKEYSANAEFNLYELEENYKEYRREESNLKKLSSEIERMSANLPNKDDEEYMDYDACRTGLTECERQIDVLSEDINRHKRDLEMKYTELEETDDLDNEIARKKMQLEECKEKYELLENTLSYLQKAKEKFSARYLGPMRIAFGKYLQLINGIDGVAVKAEDLEIDIDLNATLTYGSASKSKDSLSKGYQDLAELCIRFALVDVMYSKERPVLILDDPFVNLDENKIENALSMLREVSKDYQIIYFTCHDSRV